MSWRAPNHYLTRWWHIVNCPVNKFQWNLNKDVTIIRRKMNLKISSAKWWSHCLAFGILRPAIPTVIIYHIIDIFSRLHVLLWKPRCTWQYWKLRFRPSDVHSSVVYFNSMKMITHLSSVLTATEYFYLSFRPKRLNGNVFSMSLALCAWTSPATSEFPSQRPVTHSFDIFLDLRLNKRLSEW